MIAGPRCYSVAQLLEKLDMARRTFFRLKHAHELPFLEELKPRLGRRLRFRADLVDRYIEGRWQQPRTFGSHRKAG